MRNGLTLTTLLMLAWTAVGCGPPSVELEETFFSVAYSTPNHGAIDINVEVVPVLAFTHPVDLESLSADGNLLFVEVWDDGTLVPIDVALFPTDDLLSVELVPQASLEGGTEHRVSLSTDVQSQSGAHLATPYRFAFVTAAD